ncbi:IPExxxVDY family protein [Patiriisocius marinus]|uniref:IPExxxVDY family protein n=1 Tax=Patiriisocius marinus TaxID=1397112 RepID=A0A5J4IUW7_9FLAO|nr:IPExxxVDY family protein [Patiriisocius marinus]GER58556.1 hypothetical protein ULMA_06640 [Patiriisocius marinus]
MGTHKLILDDDFAEDFSLIAIHCSEESYKLAYLLNQFVGLKLRREALDLEYSNNGLEITFPLFGFNDVMKYTTYYLVANKCKSQVAKLASSGGLFGDLSQEETVTTILIPEYKQVDFFLKIQSDYDQVATRNLIANINDIKQVISAYDVQTENLKSKNNLIFD